MFFFFDNKDPSEERFERKTWSLMRILSNECGLSRTAAYDEICKLLWLQMMLHTSRASSIVAQTSSLKGYYSVAIKENPCDVFEDPLVVDSQIAVKILRELEEINWIDLCTRGRLYFLNCLSYVARRMQMYGAIGDWCLPKIVVDGIMGLIETFSSRNILFATGDSQELFAALLSRVNYSNGKMECTTCVPSKSLGKFLKRVAILSGLVSNWGWNDKLMSTIEDASLDHRNFDFAIINTLVLDQPLSIVDSRVDMRHRFDLTVRYFERMFALLRSGSLVVSLISRSFAGNSRWQVTRNVIERMFKICAVVDINGKWGGLRQAPLLVVFMRREKASEKGEEEQNEIYLDKINVDREFGGSLGVDDNESGIAVFERMSSFIKNNIE